MAPAGLLAVLSSLPLFAAVSAHDGHHDRWARRNAHHANLFVERADPYPTTGPEYAIPPLESIVPTPADYSSYTLPVKATYTAGTQPSLTGAPPLPAATVNVADYPTPDLIPPTNTSQVQEWIDAIDWSTIPDIPPTYSRICSDAQNVAAVAAAGPDQNCWWTCGACTRDIDITTCANTMEYGHGYDDGPGLYTNKLLTYLESVNLHATFFLVGSRVLYRPEIVQYEYMTGHELSVHTWSHGGVDQLGLTSMTNEQVVAELGYTKQIIKEVTGVTPTTMRPPFGDIDDRVRAIALAMNLMPIIWTSKPNPVAGGSAIEWDSQDWKVHAPLDQGGVNSTTNQAAFEAILDSSANFTDHGVIALQHDIYVEAVNLAIGYTLPYLLNHNPPFTLKPVLQCNGRPDQDAYIETNTNPDSPAIHGSGDVATRTSNIGYAAIHHDDPSVAPARTYDTTMPHGTMTGTATAVVNGNHNGSGNGTLGTGNGSTRGVGMDSAMVYFVSSALLSITLGGLAIL